MNEEFAERIGFMDPVQFALGPVIMAIPAAMAWALANNLKENLLDKYEPVESIPTIEDPKPSPYFRRKAVS
jgi:hypothetical protein